MKWRAGVKRPRRADPEQPGYAGGELLELSGERREQLLNYAAEKIDRFGMTIPATILLEASRPFTFLTSNLMWGAVPFFKIFSGGHYAQEIALALEDGKNVDILLGKIEALDEIRRRRDKALRQQQKKRRQDRRDARAK